MVDPISSDFSSIWNMGEWLLGAVAVAVRGVLPTKTYSVGTSSE